MNPKVRFLVLTTTKRGNAAILGETDSADTRQDLMDLLKFHLHLKWRDVAMEDDENLASDMIEVKAALNRIFREKST